jgi:hypothetical protein
LHIFASFLRRVGFCFDVYIAVSGNLWKLEGFPEDAIDSLIILWVHVYVLYEIVKVALVLFVQV